MPESFTSMATMTWSRSSSVDVSTRLLSFLISLTVLDRDTGSWELGKWKRETLWRWLWEVPALWRTFVGLCVRGVMYADGLFLFSDESMLRIFAVRWLSGGQEGCRS